MIPPRRSRIAHAVHRIGMALLVTPVLAFAQGETEKLDALRGRIEELRAKIAEAEESRTEARDQLRDSERAISEASRALRALARSEEHTSELQSRLHIVCRLLLEKKK